MGSLRADRIWMLAGATVTVLLVVAAWFLLISPKNAARDEVEGEVADTQTQLISLNKRIADLKTQTAKLPALNATLAKKTTAIPSGSGIPAFLNQLNKSGAATNVTVTSIAVGAPVTQVNLTAVKALPITMSVDGTVSDLENFLVTLQTGQTRAVLIQTASVSPNTDSTSDDSSSTSGSSASNPTATLSLTLEAFVTATTKSTTK